MTAPRRTFFTKSPRGSKKITLSLTYDYAKKIDNDIRRKNQEGINILTAFTKVYITPSIYFSYKREEDLLKNQTIKQIFNLSHSHQCWSSSFIADIRRDERRFMIVINLNQLGGIEQVFYER